MVLRFGLLLLLSSTFVHAASCPAPPTNVCNVSADPQSQNLVCGQKGTAKPSRVAILRAQCTATVENCRNACLANRQCISFETNPQGCVLYSQGPASIGFETEKSSSRRFYNRRCFTFDQSCSTSTPLGDFYLQVTSPPPNDRWAKVGNDAGGIGLYLNYGDITQRAVFNLVNVTKATGEGNLLLKGAARYGTVGRGSESAIVLTTDAELSSHQSELAGRLLCSNSANKKTFSCHLGGLSRFYDESSQPFIDMYDPTVFPNGYRGYSDLTLAAVPV